MQAKTQNYKFGLVRTSAVVPELYIGDILANTKEIIKQAKLATKEGSSFIIFPELSLTGYSIGDLFQQEIIKNKIPKALSEIGQALKDSPALIVLGAPIFIDGVLSNSAVAVYKGEIKAIVPKTYLPNYKEFYEKRWFTSAHDIKAKSIIINKKEIPFGTDILIQTDDEKITFGLEICEDLWGPLPPSSFQAVAGANIIGNLSASNELVGKTDYRRELVRNQSARTMAAYIYVSSGMNESSTDLVFSGHSLIAENGNILKESELYSRKSQIIYADIDIDHLAEDRLRTNSFVDSNKINQNFRKIILENWQTQSNLDLLRTISMNPFLPTTDSKQTQVSEEVFNIQVAGLIQRLNQTKINKIVLGLSGGLDSTLALLVAERAFKELDLPKSNIKCFTMPGFGTTKTTKSNAYLLAEVLGVYIEEIDIKSGSTAHFKDIKHDPKTEDVTFENVQARYRTMLLMNKANQLGGLVLGTGDLSEIALGWCTFNGDHISHYNVNAGVPKTLIKYVVRYASEKSDNLKLKETLRSILDTPISPELKSHSKGQIVQKTESLIGPYELHDFFLYHFIRWGSSPEKIYFLVEVAYQDKYSKTEIKKWLTLFIKRFFGNQWKRSVMSDGPKVGSVSLSPRGDWRMPSDASAQMWLEDLK